MTETRPAAPRDLSDRLRHPVPHLFVYAFAIVPAIALVAAVPLAWGWGLTWLDAGLALGMYVVSMLGVTVGFHRYFTHGSFKANRPLRIALAIAGSLAVQGPVRHWVADHRRHHAYADVEGDPHSPWRYGTSPAALVRGFWHAHMGWIFDRSLTDQRRFTPDLLDDPDIDRVHRAFSALTVVSLLGPALIGGLVTWSWWGALTAFFWAGLVRVAVSHHVAWSTNSICHLVGERPWRARDRSTNVWILAIPSMGESWHNLHHADPTSARHGVGRWEIDISAGTIRLFELLGWAHDVRWPTAKRLAKLAARPEQAPAT
ncbi:MULTISPECIES: acyl-CoA desaturase [Pseudonocardia]|uniref:Fatty acid desaturase n=2 Tax=Pseudonocardia TaxID=1847 RepID=A0A1Y2N870_PSEAH|nr:Fatty acid desaturase [Pseudonocardia autotrophica]TDN71765.1 stearoyl-CoA desaturase (delta-9 desaturase) [Pseudonocardia autotrophica]BBG02452.1 stearoyl-CoA desaturase [Pseudonocardia autotrophica]GEC23212.1 stearoyl-CoA desaturase [Pseudonocardia saturnea]